MEKEDESFMIKEDNVKTVIAALDEDNRQYKNMRKNTNIINSDKFLS